ncbi:lipopolysaccharide biosynthesis protein [Phocaeicola plebeius]|uniref:lipopolysaccharide biosynthesis protein n=1 Tax=Phocaeicola plebeius TaxID=310297 RepID=UPI0026EC4E45|nr:MATE family efflux transporter [Phocaeicola plebeius]
MERTNGKRIAKNTLMLYVRMLISMVVGLFTSRIIINTLGEIDFGLCNVVGGIVVMFGFINTAMANATSRHLTYALGIADKIQLKKTFSACVTIHIAIAIIVLILSETIGLWFFYHKMVIPTERIDAAFWVFQFSILTSMLTIINVPYMSSVIAHERMGAFAWLSISDVILKLIIVYMLMIIPYDKLITYSILLFIVYLINWSIYRIYCLIKFEECHWIFFFEKTLYKELTTFASWTLIGNLAVILYSQGLNLLLNIFFGPTINAARAISNRVQSIIVQFSNNFQTALNPQITKSYANKNLAEMHQLIFASSKYSCFLLFFLSLPIIIEADQILHLWLGIVPDYTVTFLRITFLSSIIDGISNPIIISAQATGKIKIYQIVIGGTLLLILPISYILLKLDYPPTAVYITQLIIVIAAHLIRVIMVKPMIQLSIKQYTKNVIFKIIPVCLISYIITLLTYFCYEETWLRIIYTSIASSLSMLILIYTIGLNDTEKIIVKSKIQNFLNL